MIEVNRRRRGVSYSQKWFARTARWTDCFCVVAYYQYLGRASPPFFVRQPFGTNHVALDQQPEALLAGMRRNVRYEIRRAEGEHLQWEVGFDLREFAAFHESFARMRGIGDVGVERLTSLGPDLVLSRAAKDGHALAQHAYLFDHEESRVRLLYSASARFENADSALVGRANRWCHWKDMLHFRERGIATYDLGGIALKATDPTLAGINEFKLGFGGEVVREDHWLSPLYFVASLVGAQ